MNTPSLPECRHRGAAAGPDLWLCHSPKLILPRGAVSGDTCRARCPFVDHPEQTEQEPRPNPILFQTAVALPPPREFADAPITFTQVAIGVTVAERTPPTLGRCLASLRAAGFDKVRVFADHRFEPPPDDRRLCSEVIQRQHRYGAWRNFVQTVRDLLTLEPNADGILVVQDDALFCRNVAGAVANWSLESNAGVVLLGTPMNYAECGRGLVPLTPHQANNLKAAWALLFPRVAALELANHELADSWQGWANRRIERLEDRKGIDTFVGRVMNSLRRVCYACIPSLADHVGMSTLGHGPPTGMRAAALFPGEEADARWIHCEPAKTVERNAPPKPRWLGVDCASDQREPGGPC